MPYANREKQLTYMRGYMKRKRMRGRIERLKQRKERLLQRWDADPMMKYFITKEEIANDIDRKVQQLEGLL